MCFSRQPLTGSRSKPSKLQARYESERARMKEENARVQFAEALFVFGLMILLATMA